MNIQHRRGDPDLAERYGLPNVSPLTPLDKRRLSDFRDRMPVRPV